QSIVEILPNSTMTLQVDHHGRFLAVFIYQKIDATHEAQYRVQQPFYPVELFSARGRKQRRDAARRPRSQDKLHSYSNLRYAIKSAMSWRDMLFFSSLVFRESTVVGIYTM